MASRNSQLLRWIRKSRLLYLIIESAPEIRFRGAYKNKVLAAAHSTYAAAVAALAMRTVFSFTSDHRQETRVFDNHGTAAAAGSGTDNATVNEVDFLAVQAGNSFFVDLEFGGV